MAGPRARGPGHEPDGALVADDGRDGTPGLAAVEAVVAGAPRWLARPGAAWSSWRPTRPPRRSRSPAGPGSSTSTSPATSPAGTGPWWEGYRAVPATGPGNRGARQVQCGGADRRGLRPRGLRPESRPGQAPGRRRTPGHRPRDGQRSRDSVDYPEFGVAVGQAVAGGQADLGVCVCGTGIGIGIAANKVTGIRAAVVHDVTTASLARRHNDANVICLGGRATGRPRRSTRWTPSSTAEFEGGPARAAPRGDRRVRARRRGRERSAPMSADGGASPFDAWLAGDPEVARLARRGGRPPVDHAPAHRLGELHLAGRARGHRLDPHQQVRRGLPRPSLLRRQPGRSTRSRTWPASAATALFGAEHANVQPHAGANANLAVYQALLEPGRHDPGHAPRPRRPPHPRLAGVDHLQDLALRRLRGLRGHATTRTSPGRSSTSTRSPTWPGASSPARSWPARPRTPGSSTRCPSARSPTRWARGSCSTPPTPPGSSPAASTPPRSGSPTWSPSPPTRRCAARVVAPSSARRSWPSRSTARSSPGLQGGPLEHVIAAKAVAFAEAARPEFRGYAATGGGQRRGPRRSRSPTRGSGWSRAAPTTTRCWSTSATFDPELTGKVAQEILDRAGITCNRNTIPDDPRSPFVTSGLRLGIGGGDHRGHGRPDEMRLIGALIGRTLRHRDDEASSSRSATRSATLCSRLPALRGARRRVTGPGPGSSR